MSAKDCTCQDPTTDHERNHIASKQGWRNFLPSQVPSQGNWLRHAAVAISFSSVFFNMFNGIPWNRSTIHAQPWRHRLGRSAVEARVGSLAFSFDANQTVKSCQIWGSFEGNILDLRDVKEDERSPACLNMIPQYPTFH